MRRKFLSVVLCVCMMMTMVPFAFAEENPSSGGSGSASGASSEGITTEEALKTAITNAATSENKTVTLDGDITLTSQLTISTSITLNGNGHTITAGGQASNWPNTATQKHLVLIESDNVAVNDITFNCADLAYDVHVYTSTGVTFNNVTIQNSKLAALGVNASQVTATGTFTTKCNDWRNSVNVCWGENVSGATSCVFNAKDNVTLNGVRSVYADEGDVTHANGSTITVNLPDNWKNNVSDGSAISYVDYDNAVAEIGQKRYEALSSAIAAATNEQTVTLLKDTVEAVTIPVGKTVTLDLNGHKIVDSSTAQDDNVNASLRKHTITNNGVLTIMDSIGTGVVDNVSHERAALYNTGTITEIKGGKFTSSADKSTNSSSANGNSWYVVYNAKDATITKISAGDFLAIGKFSSLFSNCGTIGEISGGTFTQDGFIAFKNEGTINKISGGTFSSKDESCIQNWGTIDEICGGAITAGSIGIWNFSSDTYSSAGKVTNISGGEIKGTTAAIRLNDYDASYLKDPKLSTTNRASATISGGKINGTLQVNTNTSLTITGGYFTSDPTAYVTTGYTAVETTEPGYNYKVVEASNLKADVAPAAPTVSIPDSFDNNQKAAAETVSDTLKASSDTVTGGGLNAAANAVANNNSVNQAEATNALGEKGITPTQGQSVRVVVQTYMNINIKDVNTANTDKKTLTLDITPMYRTVATTAAKDETIVLADTTTTGANAVTIGAPGKLTINKPVTIKLPLPAGFVSPKKDGSYDNIYVQHKGHEYIAVVTAQQTSAQDATTPSQALFATFTNPDGFSTFTISSTSTAVAKIGDNRYTTLQDAVDAVKDNETINVTGTDLSATVSGSKTFKVTGKPVTLTAAPGYNLTNSGDTYTVSRPSSSSPGSSGGSISAPTTYAVNVNAATNGAVAADKKTASKGTTVTVTASPSKGYVVDAVKVVDKDGKDVAVTEKDGKYVFTMPASAVTVTGAFKAETPAPVALPFTDVKSGNWFYDAVKYAYAQGLMTGTSATTFAPNGTMNRAMIVTVLYRLEKSPAVTGASKFTDVPAGQWYSDAVAWAAANKIVNGYDETTFGPMNAVTREQMAAILFRYEQVKGLENVTLEENLNRFPDQNKISAYAIPALQWAVGQKIINGNADGTLDPTGTATRAQVAQIFTNLLNK